MVYPDIVIHYSEAPPALRGRDFTVQEWRRDLETNELSKGNRYYINRMGLLSRLDIIDPVLDEIWVYEYDAAGFPTRAEVRVENGSRYEHRYTYNDGHYLLEGHRPEGRTQRRVYFANDDGQAIEEKHYQTGRAGGELTLNKRIVYTYRNGLKRGEMHYVYFTDGKVAQLKKVFFYAPQSSLLVREQTFESIIYDRSGKPKTSGDFKVVNHQVDYLYSPETDQLFTKLESSGQPLRLEQKWLYTYEGDLPRKMHWERLNPAGRVTAWSETIYNEFGGVQGFERHETGRQGGNYRSSFVLEF